MITTKDFVDGLVVVAENWSVLVPNQSFEIRNKIAVQTLHKADFKGIHFDISVKSLYKAFLGKLGDFWITIIFACVDRRGPQSRISSCVANVFQHQTVTREDLVKFGNRAFKVLQRDLGREVSNIFLVASRLGQNTEFHRIEEYQYYFDYEYATQLIVHYAVDFKEEGSALFFQREALEKHFGKTVRIKKDMEYYVCFLRGVGNFYFDTSNVATLNFGVKATESKFYSEAFKTCHNQMMFRRGEISYSLMDPTELAHWMVLPSKDKRNSLETLLSHVMQVKNEVDNLGVGMSSLSSRFEAIVRLTGDARMNPKRELLKFMSRNSAFQAYKIESCLLSIPIWGLKEHLETNLKPFLSTLEGNLKWRLTSLDTDLLRFFLPEMYFNCFAAEAMVAFAIYGNAHYRNRTKMYPKWILEDLQITNEFYRQGCGEVSSSWMFENLTRVEQFSEINSDCRESFWMVHWCFGEDKKDYILNNQRFLLVKELREPLLRLHRLVLRRGKAPIQKHEMPEIMDELSKQVVGLIVDISYLKLMGRLSGRKNAKGKLETMAKQCNLYSRTDIISSQHFVEDIVNSDLSVQDYNFVTWIFNLVKFIDPVQKLEVYVYNLLEETLFESGTFLPIPRNDPPFKYKLVAPFRGTARVNFYRIDQDKKESIIYNFKKHYSSSETVDPTLFQDLLCRRKQHVQSLADLLMHFDSVEQ